MQVKCNLGFLYVSPAVYLNSEHSDEKITDIREESKALLIHITEQLSRNFSEM